LLEALQVPVLVNSSVDDAGGENLLRFLGKLVNKVVQVVHFNKVVDVLGEVVGQELLAKEIEDVAELGSELDVLAGVLEGRFDLVGEGSDGGLDQWAGKVFRHGDVLLKM